MVSACEAIPSQVVWVGVWSTHWLRNLAANWNADLATEVRRSRCRFRSLPSDRCPTLIPSPAPLPSFHSYGQVDLPSNPAGHCASPTDIARECEARGVAHRSNWSRRKKKSVRLGKLP